MYAFACIDTFIVPNLLQLKTIGRENITFDWPT